MQFQYRDAIDIATSPKRAWATMVDVEGWPRWTPTVKAAHVLGTRFDIGTQVRVEQPRLPATLWTVTECRQLEGFSWVASGPGVRSEARHEVRGEGPVSVELTLTQAGPMSWLVHLLAGRMTRRYLRQEAEGLKAWCEGLPPARGA